MGGSDVTSPSQPDGVMSPPRWEKKEPPPPLQTLHKVGICVVPPTSAWPAIQAVRREHDRHFERWPPHINLVYPLLLTDQGLRELPGRLRELLLDVPPFEVTTQSIYFPESVYFPHCPLIFHAVH